MKGLRNVSLVAGVVALFFSTWGVVTHGEAGDSEGNLEEGFMWITITLMILAVGLIANALAARQEKRDRE